MNKDIIQGNWKAIKGKLKQQWGKFTDNDITTMRGTYDEIEGKLQERYGYRKEEAERAIQDFIDQNNWR